MARQENDVRRWMKQPPETSVPIPAPAPAPIPTAPTTPARPNTEVHNRRQLLAGLLLGTVGLAVLGPLGIREISRKIDYLTPTEIESLIENILSFKNRSENAINGISESMWQGLRIEDFEQLEEKERDLLFKSLLDIKGIETKYSSILISSREVVIQIQPKKTSTYFAWKLRRDKNSLTVTGYNIVEKLPDIEREYVKTTEKDRTIQRLVLTNTRNPQDKHIERFETDQNGTLTNASNENKSASTENLERVDLAKLLKK